MSVLPQFRHSFSRQKWASGITYYSYIVVRDKKITTLFFDGFRNAATQACLLSNWFLFLTNKNQSLGDRLCFETHQKKVLQPFNSRHHRSCNFFSRVKTWKVKNFMCVCIYTYIQKIFFLYFHLREKDIIDTHLTVRI